MADGHFDIVSHPWVGVYLHVKRDLHFPYSIWLKCQTRDRWCSRQSSNSSSQKTWVAPPRQRRAIVSMAEDAHILLQHTALPMHPVNHSNWASSRLFCCITLSSFVFCTFSLRSRLHEKSKVNTTISIPEFST